MTNANQTSVAFKDRDSLPDDVDESYIMKSIGEVEARIKRRLTDNEEDESILESLHKILTTTLTSKEIRSEA